MGSLTLQQKLWPSRRNLGTCMELWYVQPRKQNYQLIAIYVMCVKTLALLVEHPKDDRISKKTVGWTTQTYNIIYHLCVYIYIFIKHDQTISSLDVYLPILWHTGLHLQTWGCGTKQLHPLEETTTIYIYIHTHV